LAALAVEPALFFGAMVARSAFLRITPCRDRDGFFMGETGQAASYSAQKLTAPRGESRLTDLPIFVLLLELLKSPRRVSK